MTLQGRVSKWMPNIKSRSTHFGCGKDMVMSFHVHRAGLPSIIVAINYLYAVYI